MKSEEKLIHLKRKLLERKSKVEAMLFELQELKAEVSKLKPDNSEIVKLLSSLVEKVGLIELRPEIKVESKEVKVEPNIDVKPTDVNIDIQGVINEIKALAEHIKKQNPNIKTNELLADIINRIDQLEFKPEIKVKPNIEVSPTPININTETIVSEIKSLAKEIRKQQPNIETNQLLTDLIYKVDKIKIKPEIKVESKEVKPIFDPHIEVKPAKVHIEKTDFKTPIDNLSKSLTKIMPKNEIPDDVTMDLTPSNLWKNVLIKYPDEIIGIRIDRNNNDVIRKLTFTRK